METRSRTLFSVVGVEKLDDRFFMLISIFLGISLIGLIISVQVALSLMNISPAIDAAGRQRMLVQRMAGKAFRLSPGYRISVRGDAKDAGEFEEALAALRNGGVAAGVRLSAAPRDIRPHLDSMETRWRVFKPEYKWLLENADKSGTAAFRLRLNKLDAESEPLLAAAQAAVAQLRLHAQRHLNTALYLLLTLAAAALAVFFLAFRSLKDCLLDPLEKLTEAAGKIADGDFSPVLACVSEDEMGMLQRSFSKMAAAVRKDRQTRKITTDLLTLAVQDYPLEVFLEEALKVILSAPWLKVDQKGAIFLSENASRTLVLKAQCGLAEALKTACAAVPFGRCLCGRAAERGEMIFAGNIDSRHENSYEGIRPHGHYCVPLKSGGLLMGVLNLYLQPGHESDPEEMAQLESVASLLAGLIDKKYAHAEHRRMSEIVQQASEAVFVTETDGKIVYVNAAFEKMTGYTAEEALGKKPSLLKSGEHPPEYYEDMWTNMEKGVPWTGKIINKKKDGTFCTVQANIFPLKNSAGETISYVTIQEDVSALAEVEEQLRQSQKMEAVGRLAGGVAHDFNNILLAISGYAQFLSPALRGDAQAEADLAQINKSVDRAAALTRQLLAFSRKQKAAFQQLDLRRAVLESGKMLKRLIGENISLEITAAEDMKMIKADPGQVDQVLMNLLVNAKDAMPGGGRIELKTFPHKQALHLPTLFGAMPPDEYSVLSVRDNGSGMDKETLSKIFDPFFTTKPKGKGTGLGLSIVYGIIKHHGAYLTVTSQPEKGSAFTVYFPVMTMAIKEPAPLLSGPGAVTAIPPGVTVFLAEDDPLVMASVTRTLRGLGANVEPFSDPARLLDFAAGYAGNIPLLITDIVMPEMDGFTLAERLTRKSPKTAVIYMSGYTDPDIFKGRLEKPGIIFLQKPFRAELLAEAVVRALAAPCPPDAKRDNL